MYPWQHQIAQGYSSLTGIRADEATCHELVSTFQLNMAAAAATHSFFTPFHSTTFFFISSKYAVSKEYSKGTTFYSF